MTDTDMTQPQPPLQEVTVRGSRFTHYAQVGHYVTLCGNVVLGPRRWTPKRDSCRRCTIEASARGWTTPT